MDGAARTDRLPHRLCELGMGACAVTDHGSLFGAVDFFRACRECGVKPIIGCEVYVANRTRHDRTPRVDDDPYHLVLLAEDQQGYKNLLRLSSIGYTEGFYYKPRVDKEVLSAYSQGLVALSACLSGEVSTHIARGQVEAAERAAAEYRDIFGPNSFFLEVQANGMREQERVNRGMAATGARMGIPLVATNDVHYLRREDARAHDVLLCIQTGTSVDDPGRMRFPTDQFYLKSPDEMYREFREMPQACAETARIAERCNVELDFETLHIPEFAPPEGDTLDSYLGRVCAEGAAQRFGIL